MAPSDTANIRRLGEQLLADPVAHANNAVKLLAAVDSADQAVCKAAIQALKLFMLSVFESGDLRPSTKAKTQQPGPAGSSGAGGVQQQQHKQQQEGGEEDVYRSWLQRQYAAAQAKLLGLLQSPAAPAASQVAALAALMECVRGEEVGTFAAPLFGRVAHTLLTSRHARPEALALLVSKYLPFADVRFHSLAAVRRLAAQHTVRGAAAATAADGERAGEGDGEGGAGGSRGAEEASDSAAELAGADLARNLYDVLAHMAPSVPADLADLSSWCGAAEAGVVAEGRDAGASAKARRKRKLLAAAGGAAGAAAGAGALAAAWANAKAQKRTFSAAWLEFLRTDMPPDVLRKLLVRLPGSVIPHLSEPVLLSDFLTHALDCPDPLTAMLALNGIFLLVTRHGLEYPAFYRRLYGLLTPEAFLATHRSQFFKLADIFLASGLVPAYTAAAFAKRLARLALGAPPGGALLAVAFVHNLVRRHPGCMVLLHRAEPAAGEAAGVGPGSAADQQQQQQHKAANGGLPNGVSGKKAGSKRRAAAEAAAQAGPGWDPYLEHEPDPAASRAVESSLWELSALRAHYCPQVSAFVTVLDKDLTDRVRTSEVHLEPLLGASYSSLFAQELERRLKAVPLAFYAQPPTSLLGGDGISSDEAAGGGAPAAGPPPGWAV